MMVMPVMVMRNDIDRRRRIILRRVVLRAVMMMVSMSAYLMATLMMVVMLHRLHETQIVNGSRWQ